MLAIILSCHWWRYKLLSACLVNTAVDADDIKLFMILQDSDIPRWKAHTLAGLRVEDRSEDITHSRGFPSTRMQSAKYPG